jgi:hypothetical protein
MTPKDKANELVEKFNNYCSYEWWEGNNGHKENMKQCALIAVDEILKEYAHAENHIEDIMGKISIYIKYWQEVRQEIKKL